MKKLTLLRGGLLVLFTTTLFISCSEDELDEFEQETEESSTQGGDDSSSSSSTDMGNQTFTATEDGSMSQAVNVVYSSEGASVTYATDVASYLTISGTGAHVCIVQSPSLASEITYSLSGTSQNGSFYMDGELKATLALTDLDLTCADSAAINIENGKRINFELSGTSTLKDSSSSSGKGTWDSDDAEVKGAACLSSDGNITIQAGTLTITATGNGGKGMKCDGTLTVNGGDISVSTSGKAYVNMGGSREYDGTYTGNFDQLNDAYSTKAKAIRAGTEADGSTEASGGVVINGGNLTITTTGQQDGSEGLESKNTMYINDGTLTIRTYDDAINSAGNLYIKGGTITAIAVNNDAIDSNQNLYIEGGTILALGAGGAESGLDAAEGYSIYFNGGTLLASGGRADSPSSSSSQAWISTSGTLSAGSTVSLKNGSTTLAQFTIPSTYSSSTSMGGPGGGSGANALLLTAPGLSSGSSYTLTVGSSSTSVTATKSGSSSSGPGRRW